MWLLEFSTDGAVWIPEPDGHQDLAYLTLLKEARFRAKRDDTFARISNLELGCLMINIGPDGIGEGVEHGTVT